MRAGAPDGASYLELLRGQLSADRARALGQAPDVSGTTVVAGATIRAGPLHQRDGGAAA